MKKLLTLLLGLFLVATLFLPATAASGGPDAYGYVWRDSNEPNGPAVNWIDTNSTWVQVTGLADDNSVGQFNIGWAFHYYWADYTRVKIGSNGWLSFDNPSNVAHCFPTLPTPAGAADNILAPLMSDLNFTSSYPQFPNVGEVWYWTNNQDSFVVTYYNVPFWVNAVPDWAGDNTFQVVLSGVDSSITFTYQNMDSTFVNNLGCASDNVVGIENMTGNIGLQCYQETLPPDNYAIRFYYPDSALISVTDLTPSWNLNSVNGGVFVPTGVVQNLLCQVSNVGNTNVTSTTTVTAEIEDLLLAQVYTSTATFGSLTAGASTPVNFSPLPNIATAGQYYFNTGTVNAADINPGNNARSSEINVVDLSGPSARLTYATTGIPNAAISWSGGADDDGGGVYMAPPVYPATISSLEYYLFGTGTDYYIAEVYDDDGPNGTVGTLLFSDTILAANQTQGTWNTVTLSSPITINSGGVYIGWLQGGPTVTLGAEDNGPISQRSYEILAGQWAGYRDNSIRDLYIAANITGYPCAVSASYSSVDSATTVDFTNLSSGATSYLWDFGDGNTSTSTNPTHTYAATGTYTACLIAIGGCGNDTTCQTISVACPTPAAQFNSSNQGVTVSFSDQSTGTPSTWLWDFGDGNTSTMQNPSNTYSAPGSYLVCLTVTNGCGGVDSSCTTIQVCAQPLSNFQSQSNGLNAAFQNLSTGGTSTLWDFGDGTTSTMQNPNYTYAAAGTYTVCLITSNACAADTVCQQVSVCAPATPAFTFTQLGTFSFLFNDATAGTPLSWFWDFDDGTTSTMQNPSHAFPGFGSYDVSLVITDACGTSDTIFQNVLLVGLEQGWDDGKVELWPNPTDGQLAVQLTGNLAEGGQLILRDLTGRKLLLREVPAFSQQYRENLDLSSYANGLYFLELQGADFRVSLKVIKD